MGVTMSRAQVFYGPKDLKLVERPLDAPTQDEVQVAIKSTTLCGSDLHYFSHYGNGDIKVREPLTQGHEAAGIVVAVGNRVTNLAVGDRVAIEAGVPCEDCDNCLDGRYNVCPQIKFRSSAASFPHLQGTLQDRINHPARWCHKLPDSLSFDEGALLEPLSVAIHAARKTKIEPDSNCLIVGAGAVGLLCAAVAKHYGCNNITITDIAQNRLDFARSSGFAEQVFAIKPRKGTDIADDFSIASQLAHKLVELGGSKVAKRGGYDAVFECSGVESCVRLGIYTSRPSGCVLLVGMGNPIQTLAISAATSREVDLKGVWRYANTYPEALKLMQRARSGGGSVDLHKLITHGYEGLEAVPEAFKTAGRSTDENGNLVIKVVLRN